MTHTQNTLDFEKSYPCLSEAGFIHFITDLDQSKLKEISYEQFSNGLVLELNTLKPSYRVLGEWLRQLRPSECPTTLVPQKLLRLTTIVINKRKTLLKRRNEKNDRLLTELLHAHFTMPTEPNAKVPETAPTGSSTNMSNSNMSEPIQATSYPNPSPQNVRPAADVTENLNRLATIHNHSLIQIGKLKRENKKQLLKIRQLTDTQFVLKRKNVAVRNQYAASLRRTRRLQSKLAQCKRPCRLVSRGTQAQINPPCDNCDKLECDIDKLCQELEHTTDTEILTVKSGRKYTADAVKCILHLVSLGVSYSAVGCVMKSVLELANIVPNAVPPTSSVSEIVKIRKPISEVHLARTLVDTSNTTLYSDETSKHGQSYQTYAVTDDNHDSKVLGVRPVANKSAAVSVDTLKEIVSDLDKNSTTDAGKNILSRVKNTMSDRAATQKSFNDLLHDYRKDILSQTIPNWNVLSRSEQESLSHMYNFFCGLHLIVNAADASSASLLRYERVFKKNTAISESAVVQHIYKCTKAFVRGGDEKSGVYRSLSLFLEEKALSLSLIPFRGNRFNIIFHNAGQLYQLRHVIMTFLIQTYGTTNRLLSDIRDGFSDSNVVAGLRALGLLGKFLTGPLWKLLEQKKPILLMNQLYANMVDVLETIDVPSLMNGDVSFFDDVTVTTDDVVLQLTDTQADDVETQHLLEFIIPDFVHLFRRLLKDQLPGGVHFSASPTTNPECSSSLRHNKIPERIFAQLDNIQHHKPSASAYTIESQIMYNFNATHDWLTSLSPKDLHETLKQAKQQTKESYASFKHRQNVIRSAKIQELKRKEDDIRNKRERLSYRTKTIVTQMIEHGLWQSESEVDSKIKNNYVFKVSKMDAVKSQIRFRKNVLGQIPSDPTLMAFSKNRRQFSLTELSSNLKVLIKESRVLDSKLEGVEVDQLVGNQVCHTFDEEGKQVQYKGQVVSQVPGYRQWYNIVYASEPDTVYTYKLLEDYAAGDLMIMYVDVVLF